MKDGWMNAIWTSSWVFGDWEILLKMICCNFVLPYFLYLFGLIVNETLCYLSWFLCDWSWWQVLHIWTPLSLLWSNIIQVSSGSDNANVSTLFLCLYSLFFVLPNNTSNPNSLAFTSIFSRKKLGWSSSQFQKITFEIFQRTPSFSKWLLVYIFPHIPSFFTDSDHC